MRFPAPLVRGVLVRREKRFLVHVRLDDGRETIAHTNNTGALRGCGDPGSPVWLSPADAPHRKLKWTLELVEAGGVAVGVNTAAANRLAAEGIADGTVRELRGYARLRREVRDGDGARLDLLLDDGPDSGPNGGRRCWVEVKNVTLVRDGVALFPDAPTARGRKHLAALTELAARGDRAVMLYVVQRGDGRAFAPADDIDPAYGDALRAALGAGVEALAYRADVTPREIRLARPLPVRPAGA